MKNLNNLLSIDILQDSSDAERTARISHLNWRYTNLDPSNYFLPSSFSDIPHVGECNAYTVF